MMTKKNQHSVYADVNDNQNNKHSDCAIITFEKENNYQIKYKNKQYIAKKAFSCLVKPQKNDFVEFRIVDNEFYITAILERIDDSSANIALPLKTKITSDGEISIEAEILRQKALNYELCAKYAVNVIEDMKSFINTCYQQTDFNHIKANQILKQVFDFEQSVVNDLRLTVSKDLNVDAKSVNITTDEDTIINARSVSLG